MYVRTYVRTYVRMYVCMYVCQVTMNYGAGVGVFQQSSK